MSITSVNASIRYAPIKYLNKKDLNYPKTFIGKVLNEEDMLTHNPEDTIIPCGTKGSLVYNLHEIKLPGNISVFTLNMFGDLVDYSDTNENIIVYFNTLVHDRIINSGIIEISANVHRYYFSHNPAFNMFLPLRTEG